jgi:hypothetical protein
MKRLLVLLAACAPSQDPIGETMFAIDTGGPLVAVVGPSGHIVRADSTISLRDPTGALVWTKDCMGCRFRPAIDRDGNVYLSGQRGEMRFLEKRSAVDGTVEWSRQIPVLNSGVALDVNGAVWFLINGITPLDFGGGPVGGDGHKTRWGRYASDGSYLASGALDSAIDNTGRIIAISGGLVARDGIDFGLIAFDDSGRTLWRVGREVEDFVSDADGELTISEYNAADDIAGEPPVTLVRLDVQRSERWRRSFPNHIDLTPLLGGGVIVCGSTSLAGARSNDASFLEHVEPDGSSTREIFVNQLYLATGAERDDYRFFVLGNGSIDLHDRTFDATLGGALVGRRIR